MRKEWVLGLVLLLVLAGCSKTPPPAASETATPAAAENVTTAPAVAAPEPTPTTGRVVFAVTDAVKKTLTIQHLNVRISDVKAHKDGTADGEWKSLLSDKKSFDLPTLKGIQALLIDGSLDPGTYTQFSFVLEGVDGNISGAHYSLTTPPGTTVIPGKMTVHAGATSTVTLDFDLTQGITVAGIYAYFQPTIHLTTRNGADAVSDNTTVGITGGTVETDKVLMSDDLYTVSQLNSTLGACQDNCGSSCSVTKSSCLSECPSRVTLGCQSQDTDFCRRTCEAYEFPGDCKDGCSFDNSSDVSCTTFLTGQCSSGCTTTTASCTTRCQLDCV
jgi:hypothetical protein